MVIVNSRFGNHRNGLQDNVNSKERVRAGRGSKVRG